MEIDKKIILRLIQVLEDLKKSSKGVDFKSDNTELKDEIDLSDKIIIKSPIVGTAYLAPEPGGKKFVEVGQRVKKGQTIMIVEAMKTMNHVPSTSDGEIKKVLVEDGQAVEFGQTLVLLK